MNGSGISSQPSSSIVAFVVLAGWGRALSCGSSTCCSFPVWFSSIACPKAPELLAIYVISSDLVPGKQFVVHNIFFPPDVYHPLWMGTLRLFPLSHSFHIYVHCKSLIRNFEIHQMLFLSLISERYRIFKTSPWNSVTTRLFQLIVSSNSRVGWYESFMTHSVRNVFFKTRRSTFLNATKHSLQMGPLWNDNNILLLCFPAVADTYISSCLCSLLSSIEFVEYVGNARIFSTSHSTFFCHNLEQTSVKAADSEPHLRTQHSRRQSANNGMLSERSETLPFHASNLKNFLIQNEVDEAVKIRKEMNRNL